MPKPRHPGTILQEEFLEPAQTSCQHLCDLTGIEVDRLAQVLNCQARIEADMAILFGRCFNTPAMFWMNLQSAWDLDCAARQLDCQVKSVMPL